MCTQGDRGRKSLTRACRTPEWAFIYKSYTVDGPWHLVGCAAQSHSFEGGHALIAAAPTRAALATSSVCSSPPVLKAWAAFAAPATSPSAEIGVSGGGQIGRCGAACGTPRNPMAGCGVGSDDCWSSTSGAFCSDARVRSGADRQTRSKCIVEESTAAGSATAEQAAHSNHPPMPEPPLVARSVRLIAQSAVVTHDDVVKTTSA